MRPYLNTAIKLDPFRLLFSPNLRGRRINHIKTTFAFRNLRFSSETITPSRHLLLRRRYRCRAMGTSSPEAAVQVHVKDKIELTEIEKKIFDRLLNTLRHCNLKTELRVAGGWVRDKILGKDCYDIDIAIDNMLGSEFVDKVREYLLSTGEVAQGIGIIPRNPDQSKHLETARMRLFDLWIDFVNLRCEEYSEGSRIPTMKFGTAKEDAFRRDLTINSLFYNINTSSVEDFTERGIEDLKSGKIVTPLPPKATFLDDPLRVLRAIRFGARFGFILDEELKVAAACDDVKNALAVKISKERIGTEVDLMISGNQPVKAMTHISDLTLFWVVFGFPPKVEPAVSEGCHKLCVAYMDAAWNLIQSIGCSFFTDEQRRLCLYAALFLPFRNVTYKDEKGKKAPVVNFVFKDSLKQKVSDSETVIKIHRSIEKFLNLIPLLISNEDTHPDEVDWGVELIDVPFSSEHRVLAGFLLREIKDFWRVALLISTVIYPTNRDFTQELLDKQFQLDKRRELFKTVENAITGLGLEKIWDVKPLVNGKDIISVLQLKSGGPLVREWQQKLLAWQLAHPTGTAEECLDWMKETHSKRTKMA
ncbi:tRNA nucleotidyltransferase cca2-like [Jatropha curcas]|uniref:tRNA nucleotidyltransferase cca2-like n=1 Tax=Jatropha curcas TaxID=180498 RepID=UPI00189589B3|nr:tRNA nucleotidyltransferase cca2-like [Jatropha curcas]